MKMKDENLLEILKHNNISCFFSVGADKKVRYYAIDDYTDENSSIEALAKLFIDRYKSVNVRTFSKESSKSNMFIYGITSSDELIKAIDINAKNGFISLINQTIDINDGGVSGVVLGDVMEFSPQDTPRCVEKDGICVMPKRLAQRVLEIVYGFKPDINYLNRNSRCEFSIHPKRQGYRQSNTIVWEMSSSKNLLNEAPSINWDNNFSKFIGSKIYGLVIADALGYSVPFTTAICRNVAPFSFGLDTGIKEKWTRTVPIVKTPGKFATIQGYSDIFKMMKTEDSDDSNLAGIMVQNGVNALYSGGAIIAKDKPIVVEGVAGSGDGFMLGDDVKELPKEVYIAVSSFCNGLRARDGKTLGDITIEWCYDGERVWIVQLNQLQGEASNDLNVIVEGKANKFIEFDVKQGFAEFVKFIDSIKDKKGVGVNLKGRVGITSHFGDILRQYNIPSKFVI